MKKRKFIAICTLHKERVRCERIEREIFLMVDEKWYVDGKECYCLYTSPAHARICEVCGKKTRVIFEPMDEDMTQKQPFTK